MDGIVDGGVDDFTEVVHPGYEECALQAMRADCAVEEISSGQQLGDQVRASRMSSKVYSSANREKQLRSIQ